MAKVFCIPGIIILTIALVFSILCTISLPTLHPFDIARIDFGDGLGIVNGIGNASGELRLGIWGYCYQIDSLGGFECTHTGHGYEVEVSNVAGGTETVGSSWTRGLAVHAVACVVTGIAWLLSFSEHFTVTLVSSICAFLACFLTFLAWIIDIALYAETKHQMSNLGITESTWPGVAWYLTLVTWILLAFAGCTVCLGRRRDRYAPGNEYPVNMAEPWYRRRGPSRAIV